MFKKRLFLIKKKKKKYSHEIDERKFHHIHPLPQVGLATTVFTSIVQFDAKSKPPNRVQCIEGGKNQPNFFPLSEPPKPTHTHTHKIIFSAKKQTKNEDKYIRILFTTCYTMHNAVQSARTLPCTPTCTLHSEKQSNELYMCLRTWIGGYKREVLTCMAWQEKKIFSCFCMFSTGQINIQNVSDTDIVSWHHLRFISTSVHVHDHTYKTNTRTHTLKHCFFRAH